MNGQVWLLGLIYFILLAAGFGLTFFVPDLVQDRTGYSDFEVGVLAAVPFGIATVAMLVVARRAERAASRKPYIAGLALSARSAPFSRRTRSRRSCSRWASPSRRPGSSGHPGLLGAAHGVPERLGRRGGIALIAVLGNLGGFAGPAFTGICEDSTGGYEMPLTVLAGLSWSWALAGVRGAREPSRRSARPAPAPAGGAD